MLIHPEVNEGSQESELGAGGEDQQERLDFPAEVNTFHLVEQQQELSEVLKILLIWLIQLNNALYSVFCTL